jgi:hypothetical protein
MNNVAKVVDGEMKAVFRVLLAGPPCEILIVIVPRALSCEETGNGGAVTGPFDPAVPQAVKEANVPASTSVSRFMWLPMLLPVQRRQVQ